MGDGYQRFVRSWPGRFVIRRLGLPNPVRLLRYEPGPPPHNAPFENAPLDSARAENAPVSSARADYEPLDSEPVDDEPLGSAPVDSAQVGEPIDSAPVDSAQVGGPVGSAPVGSAQVVGPVGNVPVAGGTVLLGGAPDGRLLESVGRLLTGIGADVRPGPIEGGRPGALVFDGTGIKASDELRAAYEFFHPVLRNLRTCGRVIVLGTAPRDCASPREATAQRALEGLVRSIGKEVGRGCTASLVYVTPGSEDAAESTLRFLLSGRSAYVSGQVIRIGPGEVGRPADWKRQLAGKVALVTGASRGIGEAIADVLARDGAEVLCLDVPAQGDALAAVANRIGGATLQLDIAAPHAPDRIASHLADRHEGVDIVVHNAGVTRDRKLANMRAEQWDQVLEINLSAPERINDALLDTGTLRSGGRIIGVSSISGIAGNVGQTNYATSKAGVIGMVEALAPVLAERGITINAVAPGFIETRMTATVPLVTREAGRRLNSLAQGGLPVDVAETVAWLASPASGGITGNVVRVCGQSLLGA